MRSLVAAVFFASLAACQAPPTANPQPGVALDALRWLDRAADPVSHLTSQPSTCLTTPDSSAARRGALVFSSPLLLGGQAAKAGLSCAACHRNGRGNPAFVFTGISGAPGTADVTHGLFSSIRADGVFNPVPIPDLAAADGRTRVDRGEAGVLEAFLSAQIVEEFSGAAPDPVVINDLAEYIRALDVAACDSTARETQSWHAEIALVRAGLSAPKPAPVSYSNAMRAALGRLHDRYPGPQNVDLRDDLIELSRTLADEHIPENVRRALDRLAMRLAAAEATSYYDPEILSRALR